MGGILLMLARANTTISILRGQTVDTFGDEEPTNTPVATGVLASIIAHTTIATIASQEEPMIMTYVTGRVGYNTDIKVNDRILDERSGVTYTVDSFSAGDYIVAKPDTRLNLKVIT